MRQGNGTEILGPNDPRGTAIGIIYVSPTDDRRSVLAAIITQEKLGRKQVAVVLPNQNKAFQRPGDFDDLKSLRRKLQTRLVFIAPSGPGPAEFARQRHFDVYSSLENYANALNQETPAAPPAEKKGWLFGTGRRKPASAGASSKDAAVNAKPSAQPQPFPLDDDEDGAPPTFARGAVAGGAAAGAAFVAADLMKHSKNGANGANNQLSGTSGEIQSVNEDDWDALSPSTPPSTSYGGAVPAKGDVPASTGYGSATSPQKDAQAADSSDIYSTATAATPGIIELPRRGKKTDKLAPAPAARAENAASGTAKRRNTGKIGTAAAVAGGAVAGAALATRIGGGGTATRTGGTGPTGAGSTASATRTGGGGPPTRGNSGGNGGRGRGPGGNNNRRWWVAAALIFLTVLIVGAALAYAYPSAFSPIRSALPGAAKPATVTIVPDSQTVANSYVVLAVPGTPNAAQRQVSARSLTSQPATQTKLVAATGHNQVPASTATGRLTFTNGAATPFTVAAGTVIPAGNGISVITNGPLTIPAAVLGVSFGTASVSAHASAAGTAGNIAAGSINQTCCAADNSVGVKNLNGFTGGQDPKDYRFVQQGDIDGAISGVKGQLDSQANASLTSQLKTGEQLAGSPQCSVSTNTDQQVGDNGVNVPSLNLTVTETCKGVAYDKNGMQTLVTGLLQTKAQTDLGSSYKLVGNIIIHSKVQSVNQDNTVSLLVDVKGLWVYQFTDAEKLALARMITNKNVNEATTILKGQKGVRDATIQVNGNVLPNDTGQITIVIQNVPGLTDTGAGAATPGATTTAAPASTAPVNSPSGVTPVPGNG